MGFQCVLSTFTDHTEIHTLDRENRDHFKVLNVKVHAWKISKLTKISGWITSIHVINFVGVKPVCYRYNKTLIHQAVTKGMSLKYGKSNTASHLYQQKHVICIYCRSADYLKACNNRWFITSQLCLTLYIVWDTVHLTYTEFWMLAVFSSAGTVIVIIFFIFERLAWVRSLLRSALHEAWTSLHKPLVNFCPIT
jgi:hypothetical protein